MKEIIAQKIYQAISEAQKVLLITHYNPDGDAAAALSAMAQILTSLKKDHDLFCADQFEDKLLFLPELVLAYNRDRLPGWLDYDLIITLDCGTLARTGVADKLQARESFQKLIEIDHHEPVELAADLILRVPQAASTTEVIYDWLKIVRLPVSAPLAEAILLGLVTDTGNFLYSATSDKSLLIAAEMLSRGANWPKIVNAAKTSADLAAAKLWGLALARLKINKRYKVAFTVLTLADFEATGASDEASDGLPGFLSRLNDVQAILVLKEAAGGMIKGSWRACQDGVDVAKLCNYLGGGGHVKAAGFQIKGRLKSDRNRWRID